MKKIIIVSALLCSLLFVPVFASAQVAPTRDALTQQLIQLLTQLIAQLEQQIATILAQQQTQTTAIQQQTQTVQQIQQNTQQIAQNTQQTAQNTCTPNWQCADWSICSSSNQTRNCADSNSCGNTNGKPILSQSCTMPTPTPTCTLSKINLNTDANLAIGKSDSESGIDFRTNMLPDNIVITWTSQNAVSGELYGQGGGQDTRFGDLGISLNPVSGGSLNQNIYYGLMARFTDSNGKTFDCCDDSGITCP